MFPNCRRLVSSVCLVLGMGALPVEGGAHIRDLGGDQFSVTFTLKPGADVGAVYLAGTFNGWQPTALRMAGPDDSGEFKTNLVLPKGRHEYKFVLDGKRWITDPDNADRTEGYANAVLRLGVPGPEAETIRPESKSDMASETDHPKALRDLVASLDSESEDGVAKRIEAWFAVHPMPLMTDRTVTFVCFSPTATNVQVLLYSFGTRQGYRMHRLKPASLWALTLQRGQLPDRAAYALKVTGNGTTHTFVDPHAWSLTSRNDEPAGMVAEADPARGRILVWEDFGPDSGSLLPRDVYIYLPPGYDRNTDRRYPVLYMHDGQNCWEDPVSPFGHGGWAVNLAVERLIKAGRIEPMIIVGLANTVKRTREYGPGVDITSASDQPYIQFIQSTVKPRVDRTFRTQPDARHTSLMGSSLGGAISFQAALLLPNTFCQAACLSPAFILKDAQGRDYTDLVHSVGKVPCRLYLDSGTKGPSQDGAPATRAMVALLKNTGWQEGVDLVHFEDTGAEHNERAWRSRIDRPLVFLYGVHATSQPTGDSQ